MSCALAEAKLIEKRCNNNTLKWQPQTLNNYVRGQNFSISSLRGQFLYPDCGQKQTFFDPLPPSSCPHSY